MIDQTAAAIAKLMDEYKVPALPPMFWIGLNKILAEQAVAPAQDVWWKILADNWRGRNGNTTTGDSVRNSCADELEKVAARHSPAASEGPSDLAALVNKLWSQFYDKRPAGDPKDTYREIMTALRTPAESDKA